MTPVLGNVGWDGVRFYHTAQEGMQFKMCKLFISVIPIYYLETWLTTGTATADSGAAGKWGATSSQFRRPLVPL